MLEGGFFLRYVRITILFIITFTISYIACLKHIPTQSFYYYKQYILAYRVSSLSFMDKQYASILPRPIQKANKDFSQKPKKQPLSIYNLTSHDELAASATTETSTYTIGDITYLTSTIKNIVYFNQTDARWGNKIYGGNDVISKYGCGPTAIAMVVSSLTERIILPDEMANWSREQGYFAYGSGSYHSLIPNAAKAFGLEATSISDHNYESIRKELESGKVIVALMKKGHFTTGGHFILVHGITADGKVLIADPMSLENSLKAWDINVLLNELKTSATSGGPLWAISAPPK